jgi:anaphase-promoting complex subunit 2
MIEEMGSSYVPFSLADTSDTDFAMLSSIRKRLLHPGAETRDIITHYVSTIRAVKIIDSSGILLYAIAGPIQEYLKYVDFSH